MNNNDNKENRKFADSVNNINNNNRSLVIGFSNCGKNLPNGSYSTPKTRTGFFIITKSLNRYTNIRAQTSDKIQPINENENCTFVYDDMLLSKQEYNIDLFLTRGQHSNIDFYYFSQIYFHLPIITIRNYINKL